MKKILYSVLLFGLSEMAVAQEAADRAVQAGLTAGFGLNFQKMGTKRISTNGVGNDLTIGANVVFNFTPDKTLGFSTGAEFDFETIKYKSSGYEEKNTYYYYNDTEILQSNELADNIATAKLFQMKERVQKSVYLTIPTMMVFRTKFFGYLRYFGKFGLRNSFLLKSKINDEGYNFPVSQSFTESSVAGKNETMKAKSDMFFLKSAVGLTGGAEWNFSGSTSLLAEIGYYYGFTPMHSNRNIDKGNNYLFASGANLGNGDDVQFNNKATQSQLMLKISILF